MEASSWIRAFAARRRLEGCGGLPLLLLLLRLLLLPWAGPRSMTGTSLCQTGCLAWLSTLSGGVLVLNAMLLYRTLLFLCSGPFERR